MAAACFVSGVAPGAALSALLGLGLPQVSLNTLELVCCEQQQQQPQSSKYSVALAASSSPHSRDALARVARSMAPGGRLYVYEGSATAAEASSREESLRKDLLLSGFTDAQAVSSSGAASAPPAVWVTAQLPQWGLGAAAKLSLKRPAAVAAPVPAPPAPAAPAAGAWKLAVGGGADEEEEELLDDEELLTAEDKAAAPAPTADDCEVGKTGRKACKNCSCGRAEMEAAGESVKLSGDLVDNPQSACGNCYLGDAFRCGTCPYRGLPTFEPGQKIQLGAGMLAMDA